MTEIMMEKSCIEFADALAAKVSVPGGGGAAAYVGALGVALCSMVGNFTAGKEKFAVVEDDVQRMLADGEAIRGKLIDLVAADAEAFFPLSKAYGIPKDDPTRAEVLEEATKNAIVAPVEMMRQICKAVELLADVGCGALLCRAALEAASMNVFINTGSLTDRAYADEINAECNAMLDEYVARAVAVSDKVMAGIKG